MWCGFSHMVEFAHCFFARKVLHLISQSLSIGFVLSAAGESKNWNSRNFAHISGMNETPRTIAELNMQQYYDNSVCTVVVLACNAHRWIHFKIILIWDSFVGLVEFRNVSSLLFHQCEIMTFWKCMRATTLPLITSSNVICTPYGCVYSREQAKRDMLVNLISFTVSLSVCVHNGKFSIKAHSMCTVRNMQVFSCIFNFRIFSIMNMQWTQQCMHKLHWYQIEVNQHHQWQTI